MTHLRLCVLLMIVTSSYLTLAIFNPEKARALWAVYTVATFVLSVLSWFCDHVITQRKRGRRRAR